MDRRREMKGVGQVGGKKFKVPKVIIFTATSSERDKIIKPALVSAGLLGRVDLWLMVTGIGKVDATAAAAVILSQYATPDTVCINVGICSGNIEAEKNSPCVVIDRVYNGDFDMSLVDGFPYHKPFLDLVEMETPNFTCFTQDSFANSAEAVAYGYDMTEETAEEVPKWVMRVLGEGVPFYVDTELYGIARTCNKLSMRLVAIKSVSALVGSEYQGMRVGAGFSRACVRASRALADMLKNFYGVDKNASK